MFLHNYQPIPFVTFALQEKIMKHNDNLSFGTLAIHGGQEPDPLRQGQVRRGLLRQGRCEKRVADAGLHPGP